MTWWSRLLGVVLLLSISAVAAAQVAEEPAARDVRIYLVTFGPGDEVWEQFGHNAIEIVDPARNVDFVSNWGVFAFDSGFIGKFILGHLNYWMELYQGRETLADYRANNRSVYRQELNLSPRQKAELYDFVIWNSRPENKFYRYDYYRDNCSTRTRDAVDKAVGGTIRAQLEQVPTGTSYRFHTRRIMAADPVMYTALLFILGRPIERPISAWEESFLPLRLMDHLRRVNITDDAGRSVPLVKSEETLFEAVRPAVRSEPPHWLWAFLLLGVLLAGGMLGLARLARRGRAWRGVLLAAMTLWALFIGGAGSFALWGALFTDHWAVRYNENLLQFFPPAIVLVMLPVLVRRERWGGLVRGIAVAMAGASVVGLLIKALPWFGQTNGELIAWVLPVHLAMVYAAWVVTERRAGDVVRASANKGDATRTPRG